MRRFDGPGMKPLRTAFVLGAGLGTRLRPLTADMPKPLLPVGGRPMITHAFDRLHDAGVERILVNTHHAAHRYAEAFPDRTYRGMPLVFRHEPVLLDTGGGLGNLRGLLDPDEPLWVYNGDIFSDLPLQPLADAHLASDRIATLALRTQGPPRNVALAPDGRITDFRHQLGSADPLYGFAGIYIVAPRLLHHIPPGAVVSVIDLFLGAIQRGDGPGGVPVDEGRWHDLGTLAEYQALQSSLT